jgi:hypothetical protein
MCHEQVIKAPLSLDQAIQVFTQEENKRGYKVVGDVKAGWKGNLFSYLKDVIVSAKVRKSRSKYEDGESGDDRYETGREPSGRVDEAFYPEA